MRYMNKMKRIINIEKEFDRLNPWVAKSLNLFNKTPYLDNVSDIYPFEISKKNVFEDSIRRKIISAHSRRDTNKLIELLKELPKFPYEEPIWYILKKVKGCLEKNPLQLLRIANILYEMTSEETLIRLESAPKLNTQTGPMFGRWLRNNFDFIPKNDFLASNKGIYILESSEEECKIFVREELGQDLQKRPDLVAKVNNQYIIGEAKWIGQPGGNQGKQVEEVIVFCSNQRANVRRIGIVDGFPWALYNEEGNLISNKETVRVQESPYDLLSALLLKEYMESFV